MTKREAIIEALVSALQTIPSLTVFREAVGDQPIGVGAVAILRLQSDQSIGIRNTQQDHELSVLVQLAVRAVTAEQNADAFADLIHQKMTAVQNVGGALSVQFRNATFAVETSDVGGGSLINTVYAVTYRTDYQSLVS